MPETTSPPRSGDRLVAASLALLLAAIYLATAALRFQSIDEIAVFTVARNLVGRGTFDIDTIFWANLQAGSFSSVAPGVDGHVYSVKDVLPSLVAAPMVWLAHLLGISPIRATLISSIIVTAATGGLLYHTVALCGYPRKAAILGTLVYGLGTMAWPYTETLFTQPLAALGLLLAAWGVIAADRHDAWWAALVGGLGLGIAGGSSAGLWITGPVYVLYLVFCRGGIDRTPKSWWNAIKKATPSLTAFIAGAALFLLALGTYNAVRFGSSLRTGYHQMGALQFSWWYLAVGSIGQLVSMPRGVIWYAPAVLLALPGLALTGREHRREMWLFIGQIVPAFVLFSSYIVWWGGLAWGPRLLVPLMPSMTLLAVPALDRFLKPGALWKRLFVGGILVLSISVQSVASLLNVLRSEIPVFSTLAHYGPTTPVVEWAALFTDPAVHPYTRLMAALRAGNWDVLWMTQRGFDGLLVLANLAVIGTGALSLAWAGQGHSTRRVRVGVAAQAGLTLALAALVLGRYPQAGRDMQVDQPPPPPELDSAIATIASQTAPGDGVLTILPYSYLGWLDRFDGRVPELGLMFENPPDARSAAMLAQFGAWHPRVWMVTEANASGDPANQADRWLAENGFVGAETWIGGYRIVPYAFPAAAPRLQPMEAILGDNLIALTGYAYEQAASGSARWLNVHLQWEALRAPDTNYTVFVHLVGPDDAIAAQHDGPPSAGYAPTSTWAPDSPVDDRCLILLPTTLAPGVYRLQAGLYNPFTGERLPVSGGGDVVVLATLSIE